ncbi:thioesterase [Heliorestis acidaminivorans]|uniref:Thioesterase n=1 Tax=Heliorestis acidaminivorans TaxID=553427 RepID=A0A6I0ET24_9FIRM|nr:thioesterase family protein [Heliorestis acidaminivorans]KAB2953078.1 thioesterase [Heliorestis acidaminivorans]
MENLNVGLKAIKEEMVTEEKTAKSYGSGGVDVYATPAMIGLMEGAALQSVDPLLPEGMATVGIHLDVAHLSATPVGMKVRAEAELIAIEGKKLTFHITAYDEVDKIGEGRHQRFIISSDKFMSKVTVKGK